MKFIFSTNNSLESKFATEEVQLSYKFFVYLEKLKYFYTFICIYWSTFLQKVPTKYFYIKFLSVMSFRLNLHVTLLNRVSQNDRVCDKLTRSATPPGRIVLTTTPVLRPPTIPNPRPLPSLMRSITSTCAHSVFSCDRTNT